jgi:hypothetical protein
MSGDTVTHVYENDDQDALLFTCQLESSHIISPNTMSLAWFTWILVRQNLMTNVNHNEIRSWSLIKDNYSYNDQRQFHNRSCHSHFLCEKLSLRQNIKTVESIEKLLTCGTKKKAWKPEPVDKLKKFTRPGNRWKCGRFSISMPSSSSQISLVPSRPCRNSSLLDKKSHESKIMRSSWLRLKCLSLFHAPSIRAIGKRKVVAFTDKTLKNFRETIRRLSTGRGAHVTTKRHRINADDTNGDSWSS